MTLRNIKKIICIPVLTIGIISSFSTFNVCLPTANPEKPTFGPLSQRLIFGTLALQLCYITGNDYVKKTLAEQCYPKQLIQNFTKNYLITTFVTLIHEIGHALTALVLNNDVLDVHLGANALDNPDPLFKIGKSISIDGIDPTIGYSLVNQPINKNKLSAIVATGPIAGIIGYISLKIVLEKLLPTYSGSTDPFIINQLFNLLIPTKTNDAALLYTTCLGMPQKSINTLSFLTQYSMFFAEFYHLQAMSEHPELCSSHSKALLAFANWHLNGFARFHL